MSLSGVTRASYRFLSSAGKPEFANGRIVVVSFHFDDAGHAVVVFVLGQELQPTENGHRPA
jgi:hypothetical protein